MKAVFNYSYNVTSCNFPSVVHSSKHIQNPSFDPAPNTQHEQYPCGQKDKPELSSKDLITSMASSSR